MSDPIQTPRDTPGPTTAITDHQQEEGRPSETAILSDTTTQPNDQETEADPGPNENPATPVPTPTPSPEPETPPPTSATAAPASASAGTEGSHSEASGTQVEAHASTGEKEERPPREPTMTELVTIYALHALLGVSVVAGILIVLNDLDRSLNTEFRIDWEQPADVRLRSGPAAFLYDRTAKELIHRGVIDDKEKGLLVALAEPRNEEYERAVDALAFNSYKSTRMVLNYTLLLGGLGGVIGVLMRNISNFLGVACFKKNFYYPVWWPWYFQRPILAFLTGMVLVVLLKSDLLTSPQSASQGSLWFIGLAALAGFGVDDFLGRLRVLSKTVFPPEEPKASAQAKVKTPATKPTDKTKTAPPPGGLPPSDAPPTPVTGLAVLQPATNGARA